MLIGVTRLPLEGLRQLLHMVVCRQIIVYVRYMDFVGCPMYVITY